MVAEIGSGNDYVVCLTKAEDLKPPTCSSRKIPQSSGAATDEALHLESFRIKSMIHG